MFKNWYNRVFFLIAAIFSIIACNRKPNTSVEKADSANRANLDTSLQNNQLAIDEKSSAYLVRIADGIMMEKELAYITMHQGIDPGVKDFASRLYHELIDIHNNINSLAGRKKIVIPGTISQESFDSVTSFKKARGRQLDERFLDYIVKSHESMNKMFEEAMTEAKDEDVRSFSDICFILFRKYLLEATKL